MNGAGTSTSARLFPLPNTLEWLRYRSGGEEGDPLAYFGNRGQTNISDFANMASSAGGFTKHPSPEHGLPSLLTAIASSSLAQPIDAHLPQLVRNANGRGCGTPLVPLHGWPEFWYVYRKNIPVLAESLDIIVPELRGFGDTEKPGPELPKIEVPTRYFWADDDPLVKIEWADRLGDHFSDDSLEAASGAGHFVHYEKPEAAEARFRRTRWKAPRRTGSPKSAACPEIVGGWKWRVEWDTFEVGTQGQRGWQKQDTRAGIPCPFPE